MSILNLNADSVFAKVIRIGYEGENVVTQINFNLQMWIDEYGLGGVTLLVLRHGDKDAYPVPLMIEDGVASWSITQIDTAKVGRGAIQLKYVVDEKIKKSPIFEVSCLNALDDSETVPDPYDSWLATLTYLAEQTTANAQAASAAASTATEKASEANASAQTATDKATLATNKAQAASDSADIAEEAKEAAINNSRSAVTKADEARNSATQAAASATSAQQSAVNAQTSATAAAASSAQAQHYAENASAYLMTDEEATNLLSIAKGEVNE